MFQMGWFKHHLFFFVKGQRFATKNSWSPPKTWDLAFFEEDGGKTNHFQGFSPWFEKTELFMNLVKL